MRLRKFRRPLRDRAEFALGACRVAARVERRAEPVAKRRVVRIERETLAKGFRRRREVAAFQRLHPAIFIRNRAVEHIVVLQQRIVHLGKRAAPLPEVRRGLVLLAERAIGHRERIVHGRGVTVGGQGAFEIVDRFGIRTARQRDAACAEERRRRLRLHRKGACKRRLGVVQAAVVEIRLAQPDERVDIGWRERHRAFECPRRSGAIAFPEIRVTEVVRPARIGAGERRGVLVTEDRFVAEPRRHQHAAERAVRGGEICRRLVRRDRACEIAVAGTHLLLNRRRQRREIGQERPAEASARGGATAVLQAAPIVAKAMTASSVAIRPPHRPVPSTSVVYRSIARSCHSSVRPSGQMTRTPGVSFD